MDKKKTGLMLSILGVLSIVLITAGVTYAFFSYSKEGSTENVITTGTLTFIYEEVEKNGAGISIKDAYPIADSVGKAQSGAGNVFNFSVKSETASTAKIPYTVTARMKSDSTLDQDVVRMYLTEVDGTTETQVLLDNYNNLTPTSVNVPEGTVEKVIYTDTVPAGESDYVKNFRLRMWIDEDTKFTQNSDGTYPYNGKTFTVTVNVYANAEVVNITETPVAYYAFGLPTTASSVSFLDVIAESGSNTFVKLEGEQLSVCIYRNETLECFKNNNYEEESSHLISVFGENGCSDDGTLFFCNDTDFSCGAFPNGDIDCTVHGSWEECNVSSDGSVSCS